MKPDVVLPYIKFPVLVVIKATEILKKSNPDLQIIALTMYEEDQIIIDMLDAGATGYLMKNSSASEIVDAIDAVYRQTFYYCGHTSATLARLIASSKFNPHKKKADVTFNERELDIIRLLCSEHSNAEIGEKLSLSTRTIEGYRAKIMEKMNVKSNVGIVVYSIKNNIYSL